MSFRKKEASYKIKNYMIKRFLLAVFTGLLLSFNLFADEQRKITLNNEEHTQEIVELPYCNIIATLKEVDENDNVTINVELENIQESKIIILFDRAYNEKELKKQRPSIRYHKIYPGDKGKRVIDFCSHVSNPVYLKPYSKVNLQKLDMTSDSVVTCRLPIYIAESKKKDLLNFQFSNKLRLQELQVIELEIHVKLKPDEEYINLTNAYNQLLEEISKETFCRNKNHRGMSCMALIKKYKDKIEQIKGRVDKIVRERNYFTTDKKYKIFMEISQKLDAIDFESKVVKSCSNDRKRIAHTCRYCSWSDEQIYRRLENIYIDIHNGKKNQQSVMGEVEALHNCYVKNAKRKRNENYKSRIAAYYNKIKSL